MARVLVACEFSGVVRNAFLDRGHDAWSCDLLPTENRPNRHITGDVRDVLHEGWDCLIVAHPPCTRLCRSGRRWLSGKGKMTPPKKLPKGRTWGDMKQEFEAGIDLFLACWNAPIPHIALENPEMHDLARDRMPDDLPRPQIVQPHQFGHPEYKATGLYLKNLSLLAPTIQLVEPEKGSDEWKTWQRVWRMGPSDKRGHERSRFFSGIADAMADQWGPIIDETDRRLAA
nr:hypothetical protein [uncultured Cohaesibacter sp.]